MATNKPEATNTVASEEINKALADLLNELLAAVRPLNPKKTTKRQIKRGIANIEAILADIKEEVSK
ncbi:hypothetical protein [Methylomonas koyamae]|uniref:hypothetical protein n=1 Tax=Methylomonas koyamae TaxID=702114 RepID=UPI0006D01698|nr:hypothetical protein [Methylomonas koyamae]